MMVGDEVRLTADISAVREATLKPDHLSQPQAIGRCGQARRP